MFTSIQLAKDINPEFQSSVHELFQSTSRTLIYAIGAIYLALIVATAIWPVEIAMNTWAIVPASLIFFWLSLWLLPRAYLLAHMVLQIGLVGSITLAVYLFQTPEIAFFYALLPLISVVCLGWRTGSIMLIVISCTVYWLNHGLLFIPPSLALSIVVVISAVMAGMLGWAAMQAVLTVTEWSLYSFQQARKNLEDARENQGKLAHVVKELDLQIFALTG